jgi:hypothetical protein
VGEEVGTERNIIVLVALLGGCQGGSKRGAWEGGTTTYYLGEVWTVATVWKTLGQISKAPAPPPHLLEPRGVGVQLLKVPAPACPACDKAYA